MRRFAIAILAVLIILLVGSVNAAEGHHTGQPCFTDGPRKCLPLLPSPFMNDLAAREEILWCLNDRALAYPNFQAQVQLTQNVISEKLGVPNRRVDYGTPATSGCWIKHDMVLNHGCSGCGAWVHYLNRPILIEYNEPLSYFDWKTTIGHELGHAILGIHEQYDDDRFLSHIRTYGYWATNGVSRSNPGDPTVLDFGTQGLPGFPSGVWEFQDWDVQTGCGVLDRNAQRLTGCGFVVDPENEWGECADYGACWNNWLRLWVWFRNGQVWVFDPLNYIGPQFDHYHGWWCTEGCP